MKKLIHSLTRFILLVLVLPGIIVSPNVTEAQGPGSEEQSAMPTVLQLPSAETAQSRAFSGGADYDSGWVGLEQDATKTLVHNLGGSTNTYVVDMQYRNSLTEGINQRNYGGVDLGAVPSPGQAANDRVGAYWRSLTSASITVYRRPEDTYAEQVRIRIWIDAAPDYDSGWFTIAVDTTHTFTHSLAGDVNDYVVDMQFKSASSGVNQRYIGGCDLGAKNTLGTVDDRIGAYWRTLTTTQITVYRRPEDAYAEQVRIRIWVRPRATYDSGWVNIGLDAAITLTHNVGGQAEDYQVIMDFKAADVNGINNRAYGGMDIGAQPSAGQVENDRVGAYWRTLTSSSVVIYRRPQDSYAPQIRIRIFRFWEVPPPNYDSGWQAISVDGTLTLTHNLGGDANSYMVDMQYKSQSVDGINQRYYGGSDFGNSVDIGNPNDRVGVYWRTLTSTSIIVYRRPEDSYAAQVRVRIWKMPKPDYNSGWIVKAAGEAATLLNHNLGGDYQKDYLVYFDYRNAGDGINQRYYGGADFGSLSFSGANNNDRVGAYWRQLNATSVAVYRRPEDTYAEQLRLRIWRIQVPDFSSGWVALNKNQASVLTHNVGGLPDGYLVQMLQWDTNAENTVNQRHYGGADFGNLPPAGQLENDRVGTYWRSLTRQNITVYRRPEDSYAEFVMVRIWDVSRKVYLPALRK
jgi:hypothetical protein